LHRLIARVSKLVPRSVKTALLGPPDSPSIFAQTTHALLNRLPVARFPVLACGGELEGYRMRIDWRTQRAYVYGTWEPEVVAVLKEEVAPGSYALQIGAHIGFYALLLCKLVGSEGKVVAFEPLPANFKVLEENLRLNGCSQGRAVNKAVLARSQKINFAPPAAEALPSSVSLSIDYGGEPIEVEAVSVDEFLAAEGMPVDLIMMDVEGAEEEVLRGARGTIEKCRPTILLEVHHFYGSTKNSQAILLLQDWQYEVQWIDHLESTSHVLAKPVNGRREPHRELSGGQKNPSAVGP